MTLGGDPCFRQWRQVVLASQGVSAHAVVQDLMTYGRTKQTYQMPGVPHASQPEFVMVAHSVEAFLGGELSRKLGVNCAEDFDG